MNYKSFADLSQDIKFNLHKIPKDISLVVGVPRSGLLAANVLAIYLNLPFTDVDNFIRGEIIANTSNTVSKTKAPGGKILIVDDSIATGRAQAEVRERLNKIVEHKYEFIYCCVYVTPGLEKQIDIPLVFLETPRAFEWNIYKHKILKRSCVSIEGVLAYDMYKKGIENNQLNDASILNAKPLIIPKIHIATLVTNIPEVHRPSVTEWLKRYKVPYDELIMSPKPMKSVDDEITFKAAVYKEKKENVLFFEGSPSTAKQLLNLSGKDVFCVEANELMYKATYNRALKKAKKRFYYFLNSIKN